MSKGKRKSKAQRRRRHDRREAKGSWSSVGIGDEVYRGKGKRRRHGVIIGWAPGRRGTRWIVAER